MDQAQLVAAAKTQYPKEARMFIDFVARPKQNSLYCKVQGCAAGDDFNKGIFPAYMSDLVPLIKNGQTVFSPAAGCLGPGALGGVGLPPGNPGGTVPGADGF